jgi:hypothetical protein
MPGTVISQSIGVFPGWVQWRTGEGQARAEELARGGADEAAAQESVQQAVVRLDALCQADGLFFAAGLWVPDRTTGVAVATAQLELLTGAPDRDASWADELERARAFRAERGFKVFDRAVEPMTLQAGLAFGTITVLAETPRGGLFNRRSGPSPVETRIEVTVFPPGSSDVLRLAVRSFESDLLDPLVDQARNLAESIKVVVGPVPAS